MGLVPKEPSPGTTGYTYNAATTTYTITAILEGQINDLGPGQIIASESGLK
jgi:hypothetical protein